MDKKYRMTEPFSHTIFLYQLKVFEVGFGEVLFSKSISPSFLPKPSLSKPSCIGGIDQTVSVAIILRNVGIALGLQKAPQEDDRIGIGK